MKLLGFPIVELDLRPRLYGKWTTTPPTQEGWYWVKTMESDEIVPAKFDTDNTIWIWGKPYWESVDLALVTHWLGPLPIPEPPNP